jgi:hypothetical protein
VSEKLGPTKESFEKGRNWGGTSRGEQTPNSFGPAVPLAHTKAEPEVPRQIIKAPISTEEAARLVSERHFFVWQVKLGRLLGLSNEELSQFETSNRVENCEIIESKINQLILSQAPAANNQGQKTPENEQKQAVSGDKRPRR